MPDLRDHEADLLRATDRLASKAGFAEVMAERSSGVSTRLDSKSTSVSVRPRLHGAIFRIWSGDRWAEAATSSYEPKALGEAVELLERTLAGSASSSKPPGEPSTTRGAWTTKPARPARDLGTEGMISLAKDALGWALAVKGISEAQVRLSWDENERLYLNSAGARCLQTVARAHALAAPIAIEHGRAEYDYLIQGGVGGQELYEILTEERVKRTARDSLALLAAKAPPTGEMAVVLDPTVAGLFAHESFGHGTEADQFVRNRSYLKPLVGQTVGPQELTIVDDGRYPGGWGTIYCDDEGHLAQKTVLVDRGKFVGALHDRETAAALGAKPTGNTRRANFVSRAFVRMTNTYVEPGDRTLDELVAEAKNGVLLEHGTSGIEDPLGGRMQLKVKKGRKIENGRLTDVVSSMALSGRVLDFMKSVSGVARTGEFEIEPGFCGKGHTDMLPVGSGGVAVLSRAVIGPA